MTEELVWHGPKIRSWGRFQTLVKDRRRELLSHLDRFPDALLVAGCQRSGTTAVARLLGSVKGMADFRFGSDDELDAALILCGYVDDISKRWHCDLGTYE